MKKTLLITIAVIALLALYKKQHIRPVENPKDSPLFQQRLQSSLQKFQEAEFPDQLKGAHALRAPGHAPSPQARSPAFSKELTASGRCGTVYLSWVEEKKIAKENIRITRKAPDQDFSLLKASMVYEIEEAPGTRYWVVDRGLTNDTKYEYLISCKDPRGKEMVKEPVSIALTCNEKDREILAQQEKMAKEYYQQRGAELKDSSAIKTPVAPIPSPKTGDLFATGRCGRVTLTWVEEKEINKERIEIKRRKGDGDYSLIKTGMVYDKAEGQGRRYWVSDSGLIDGTTYEYLISFKDASEKEGVRGPVFITLTCTDQDKAIEAQREQAIKEYYQKKGIDYSALKASPYQLSKEAYTVDIIDSPHKGKADAPVTLVVFTDFECVHCATWAQTLDTVQKTFPSDVKIVFKNFLIPYHKNSALAAKAALAAGEQGKFWEMHDLLFKHQNALSKNDILNYAQSIKLNLTTFQKYLESEKAKIIIEKDKAQGKLLGVENAPTTFFNERSLIGSPPFPHVKGLIEDILKNKIK